VNSGSLAPNVASAIQGPLNQALKALQGNASKAAANAHINKAINEINKAVKDGTLSAAKGAEFVHLLNIALSS
jgi:hypothetical protein